MDALEQKYQRLQDILTQFSSVAVAFSGGVDSTFLLYAAQDTLEGNALAVTAVTAALPQRERQGGEGHLRPTGRPAAGVSVGRARPARLPDQSPRPVLPLQKGAVPGDADFGSGSRFPHPGGRLQRGRHR